MARIVKPPMFCDRLIEACRYEYKTRNLIDGRIVQCDQRISIVAGYMTEEISGLSPFTFIHRDDVRWVMVALRQSKINARFVVTHQLMFHRFSVYDFSRPYGESCYRLMSRTGQFIYLKTRGCLEVDEKTRQVHSFVCVNTLVSDDEGRRLIREMKKKFSAIISEEELSAMESDVPAVENPNKLERAILNLITNLNTASYDDDNASMISDSTVETDDNRRVKSPPLAIIAPKSSTIKSSIFKAVAVIGQVSKGKSPTSIKDEPKSPESSSHLIATSPESTTQLSIKVEPSVNLLSPTSSSMSSIDSDASSPFLATTHHVASTSDRIYTDFRQPTTTTTNVQSKLDEFFTPYDNLPVYDIDTPSAANGSIMIASNSVTLNNNNSNNNRNSVLKRTYDDNDGDYAELIKKRTLSSQGGLSSPLQVAANPPMDMLNTSATGNTIVCCLNDFIGNLISFHPDINDVLSSTFPEDSLTEQFRYESSSTPQLQSEEMTVSI